MKRETQAIEFKQSWRDEYLEWICGYANAYGGTLYIGRADDGAPVGVAKAKVLMESIPCKITDTMGIIADVNLLNAGGKDVIEIKVEKYPSLISYHGKYFYRSGTTMRTISGILEKFSSGSTPRDFKFSARTERSRLPVRSP